MNAVNILQIVGVLVFLVLGIYALAIEPHRIQVSRIDIRIPNLPEPFRGLKICHLSDMHTTRFGRLEKAAEEILARNEADLCVITGDLLGSRAGVGALCRLLSSMKAPLGVFAVPGNGDYKAGMSPKELAAELKRSGAHLLLNERIAIPLDGQSLHVIGVDDPFFGFDDLSAAMSGLGDGGFKLLLAHSPDILMKLDGRAPDLILAGHTHGGQIRLPLIGPLWLHSRYKLRISDGYFEPEQLSRLTGRDIHGVRMYVSRGLGCSGIRARFACPPEIVLITLH